MDLNRLLGDLGHELITASFFYTFAAVCYTKAYFLKKELNDSKDAFQKFNRTDKLMKDRWKQVVEKNQRDSANFI